MRASDYNKDSEPMWRSSNDWRRERPADMSDKEDRDS